MSAWVLRGPPVAGAQRPGSLWRRALSYGVLWGVAAVAIESFALPLGELHGSDVLRAVGYFLLHWCPSGVLLVALTVWIERRRLTLWLAAAGAVAITLSFMELVGHWNSSVVALIGPPAPFHTIWGALFYGGLFIAAYGLSMRSERTRSLLAEAEIARQQTEALLSTERLQALQGQVDPAFLLRVMAEVERRYVQDRAAVDRLLDPLVGFLRAAMPGVRHRASTLQAEVLLAMQYSAVWAELEPARVDWCFDVEQPMPDMPFPALLLLPVLDSLSAVADAAPHAELEVRCGAGGCTLSIDRARRGHSPWLAPALTYRLQVGLREMFGDAWTLAVADDPERPAFELTLPLGAAKPAADPLPSSPTAKEASHG